MDYGLDIRCVERGKGFPDVRGAGGVRTPIKAFTSKMEGQASRRKLLGQRRYAHHEGQSVRLKT